MSNSDLKELELELMIAHKYGLSKQEIQNIENRIKEIKAPAKKSLLERFKKWK